MKKTNDLKHSLALLLFFITLGYALSSKGNTKLYSWNVYRFIDTSPMAEDVSQVCTLTLHPRLCSLVFPSQTGEYYLDPFGYMPVVDHHVYLIP